MKLGYSVGMRHLDNEISVYKAVWKKHAPLLVDVMPRAFALVQKTRHERALETEFVESEQTAYELRDDAGLDDVETRGVCGPLYAG